ncbi:peptidase domain-containing ABC transporter [Bacillus thuringiensis]|uniref:peptidase domain-containing ABC transporter n=1 Tax=Bacillus thuringiensis TaxID=1428 RepID=UPI003D0BEB12
MRKKVPYIEQMEHSECGLACLGMVLGYYGYHVTLSELRNKFGTSKKGTSLYHLVEMGEETHLKGKVYKADYDVLSQISCPAILFWENKHYVVLERINKSNISIVDPLNGRRKVSPETFKNSYSGYVLKFETDEKFVTKKKELKLNFLLQHILMHKNILISIMLVAFLLQGIGLVIPKLTQWVVDKIIVPNNAEYTNILGISVLGLFLFYQVFAMLRGYLITILQTRMDSSLMSAFISKLFSLKYSFFEARTSGELIYRANSNVIIRQILSSRMISLIIDMVLIIGYAIMMFYMQLELSLLVVLLCSIITGITLLSTRLMKKLSDQNIIVQTKTQSYLTESIHGICDVKILGAEKKVFNHWHRLFHNQLKASQKQNLFSTTLESFSSGIQFITPLILLWVGSIFILKGEFTIGELLGFSALATSFMVPIISMGNTYSQLLLLGAYVQRLQDVMESESENIDGHKIKNIQGEIEFKDVSFKYDHFGSEILSKVNLKVAAGEKVAIVGPSGSGKSSLAKLLLGLYSPTNGQVIVDGKPLEELNLHVLRSQMGAVLQETRLSHGNIIENIQTLDNQTLDNQISLERVVGASQLADIHEEILKQPMGYYTMISEGGSNFSGGQKQRLLLARALANDPKILILDEATSALDNLSESRVQQNLRALDCTQIIIAHRLSTVRDADRIIVLKDGKIQEIGNHQELLKREGIYHQLYTIQEEHQNEEVAI